MKIEINTSRNVSLYPLLYSYFGGKRPNLVSRIDKAIDNQEVVTISRPHVVSSRTFAPAPYFWQRKQGKQRRKTTALLEEREAIAYTPYESAQVLRQIAMLPMEGVLQETRDGMVYLKLSDAWIDSLGLGEMPPFVPIGAHIPVIKEGELKGLKVKEIGETFSFVVTGLVEIVPETWAGVNKAYAVTIDCEELSLLREKYRLPSSLSCHPFAVVIGVQRGAAPKRQPTYRINPAIYYS